MNVRIIYTLPLTRVFSGEYEASSGFSRRLGVKVASVSCVNVATDVKSVATFTHDTEATSEHPMRG
jgi:hypothetical protein